MNVVRNKEKGVKRKRGAGKAAKEGWRNIEREDQGDTGG